VNTDVRDPFDHENFNFPPYLDSGKVSAKKGFSISNSSDEESDKDEEESFR